MAVLVVSLDDLRRLLPRAHENSTLRFWYRGFDSRNRAGPTSTVKTTMTLGTYYHTPCIRQKETR